MDVTNSYKFIVFDLITTSAEAVNLKEELTSYFKSIKATNIVYPTHDGKVYVVFKHNDYNQLESNLNANQGLITIKSLKLKQISLETNGFSDYGYYKLKRDIIPKQWNFNEKQQYFQSHYGLTMTIIIDSNTQEEIEMLSQVNTYQFEMLNHYLKNKLNPNVNQTIKHSTIDKSLFNILKDSNKSLLFENNEKNIKFEIKRGDLLEEKVNVIVNAANERLKLGGGVAGAIELRCGRGVQKECDHFLEKSNLKSIEVSQVMHTKAFNINAKYIIHGVGPMWANYNANEKDQCFTDLKNTLFNILIYAETKLVDVESIAIPLISSGIYSVPKKLCCRAVYEAIEEYLIESNDSIRKLKLVVLVNLDKSTNDIVYEYFSERIKSQLNNNVVSNKVGSDQFQKIPEKINPKKCDHCGETKDVKKGKCDCYYCTDCYENYEQNGSKCTKH